MNELPQRFLERMRSELGENFPDFLRSYEKPTEKGIRVNTLKISAEDFMKISPFTLERIPWEDSGFYVQGEGLGKTPEHAAGLYYVQEPSAMSVAPKLEVKSGERVLDLCSAPGGKGTQLAQRMQGGGLLFLNEINYSRAKILSSNVERLGVRNAVVTGSSPEKLARRFTEYFDKILVDAPCSGEGMFKKEASAIPEWSPANVTMCAERQADILDCAYRMLAGGGRMVYSTCTFAVEEDEGQVADFLSRHADCVLIEMKKLYPHEFRGEGHFYAVLEKKEGNRKNLPDMTAAADAKLLSLYRSWSKECLAVDFQNLHAVGKTLYSLPEGMPQTDLQILRAGIRLGETDGKRFIPSHSLAMCLEGGEAETLAVDEQTALNYLRGMTFSCDENIKGWRLVVYRGYPLGWCKATGGVAKNHLPKGLRI